MIFNVKNCPRCKIYKTIDKFYSRKTRISSSKYCKSCTMAQSVERQRECKIKCVKYKGGECVRCGYSTYVGALVFHHLNPKEKDFNVSGLTSMNEKVRKELDKCILVCSNCHKEIHAEMRNQASWISEVRTPEELDVSRRKRAANQEKRKEKIKNNLYYRTSRCPSCNSPMTPGSKTCEKCRIRKTKIVWPSTDKLIVMVDQTSYSSVGRKLGVSDNAVRKRIKNH